MRTLRIAIAQMNPTVGDLRGNVRRIKGWLQKAKKARADVVVFPELAITGSPPKDLLLRRQFVEENQRALLDVARASDGLVVVVGYVAYDDFPIRKTRTSNHESDRPPLYNAAGLIANRRLVGTYRKQSLSRARLNEEHRYFHTGQRPPVLLVDGIAIGVTIGEEIGLPDGPTCMLTAAGAEVIVDIDASPFSVGKRQLTEQVLADSAREHHVVVAYANIVGGQDELVFDGNSQILDRSGNVLARACAFQEELLVADVEIGASRAQKTRYRATLMGKRETSRIDRIVVRQSTKKGKRSPVTPNLAMPLSEIEDVYQALVVGVSDYARKNGFRQGVIGLSGGVDSALTAAVAVDALGAEHVIGVFMPSPYTSGESEMDVIELAKSLGIVWSSIPITPIVEAYQRSLEAAFAGRSSDATEENIQARIRGNFLMALSNKFGYLVLATGNKSEMSVGYGTLYGDMAGGFAVLKDVPKTMVYDLVRYRNQQGSIPVIPQHSVDRPPTAELRPDQKDEDSLPPYDILDPILQAYVEEDRSLEDIVKAGFDRTTVARVITLVRNNEFKRQQAPLGIKITRRAFGTDRRMPVTNGYRDA